MTTFSFNLIKNKNKIFGFSIVLILFSLIGILYSTLNTSFKKPINLGMDFIGGNESSRDTWESLYKKRFINMFYK